MPPMRHIGQSRRKLFKEIERGALKPAVPFEHSFLVAGFLCNGRGIAMTTAMGKILADWASGTDSCRLAVLGGPPQVNKIKAIRGGSPSEPG